MQMDTLQVLGVAFVTAASPAITEAIKYWHIPSGMSPALNLTVSLVLHLLGYVLFEVVGGGGGDINSYLLSAFVVAGVSGASVSAVQSVPAFEQRSYLSKGKL